MRRKDEICQNARNNGIINDPRTNWNNRVVSACGFKKKKEIDSNQFPNVCGNCDYYSVC